MTRATVIIRNDSGTEKCPWFAISKCPLYIASHAGYGDGCVDDMARPCQVQRGEMDYFAGVEAMIANRFPKPVKKTLAEAS